MPRKGLPQQRDARDDFVLVMVHSDKMVRKKNRSKRSEDYKVHMYVQTNLVRLYSIIPGSLADRLADLMRSVVSVQALEALFSVQAEVVPWIRRPLFTDGDS
jgi:hypothetical protein